MTFETMAIPLTSPTATPGVHMNGTGFLAKISGQTYLATVAHIATGKEEILDNWSLWSSDVIFWDAQGNQAGQLPLFKVQEDGLRLPEFKFVRTRDIANVLVDAILLPIPEDHPLIGLKKIFQITDSPADCHVDQMVTVIGYLKDPSWPTLEAGKHRVSGADVPVFSISPAAVKGYSGGPVITASGNLVGMLYGAGNDLTPGEDDGLVVAVEVLNVIAATTDGRL
ncbi:S1 family peptidase (plasmid) [Arthrobacter sp. G.S.26]|uniref:S1 family peptidase n=1 Tax=Arthrobacter sp. G.S.26 TaxID=3433706 RepID=UPI003D778D7E